MFEVRPQKKQTRLEYVRYVSKGTDLISEPIQEGFYNKNCKHTRHTEDSVEKCALVS